MKYTSYLLAAVVLLSVSCKQSGKKEISESNVLPEEVASIPVGIEPGNRAAEIVLPDTEGEMQKLSALRGKVVLLDFWASWCPPCRQESPALVKAYADYKDKEFEVGSGFEIVSVSLDKNGKKWKDAIESDGLSWDYHLSDLEGAKSKTVMEYKIQTIPTNFLLDRNGVIIAVNLRGAALEEKLEELLPM